MIETAAPIRRHTLVRLPRLDPLALPGVVFLVLLITLGTTAGSAFLSPFNTSNVLLQVTPLLLIAIGQTFAVASGGLDLSVGSTASLTAVIAATLFQPLGVPVALLVAVAAGCFIGLINGVAIAAGFEPFLVTLAMLSVAQGLALFIRPTPGGTVPEGYTAIAGFWNNIPVALPLVLIVAIGAAAYLRRSRTGAHVLAVGGDTAVARLMGIRVERTLVKTYVITALFAALAGLFLVARTRTGDPLIGSRFALDSLAAVVVGGTVLGGGRATLAGTVLGAAALGLLSNVLNLIGVPTFYQTVAKGIVLIAAILLPSLGARGVTAYRRRREAAGSGRELVKRV